MKLMQAYEKNKMAAARKFARMIVWGSLGGVQPDDLDKAEKLVMQATDKEVLELLRIFHLDTTEVLSPVWIKARED